MIDRFLRVNGQVDIEIAFYNGYTALLKQKIRLTFTKHPAENIRCFIRFFLIYFRDQNHGLNRSFSQTIS